MAYSHTAGAAVDAGSGAVTVNPPGGAGTDQSGKLLVLVAESSLGGATITTAPSGFTRIDSLDDLAVYYKHGGASEPGVSVGFSGGAIGARMFSFEDSVGSWAAGASVLAASPTSVTPANGADIRYPARTTSANGNLLVRVGAKRGSTSGFTISSIATTSGYTQAGIVARSNVAGGLAFGVEYRSVSGNATDDDAVITTWTDSRPRSAVAFELVLAASAPSVTATDGTVQIGEAGLTHAPVTAGTEVFTASPAFSSAISGATLDPGGAAINITSLLSSLSTTNATLTAPDVALFRVGGAWNAIRWGVDYVIRFTDGTDTAEVNCRFTAPVPTRFGAVVTPDATNHPAALIATDEAYGLYTKGEGVYDPADGYAAANIFVAGEATLQPFGYDISAGAWIEGTAVTFADGAIAECPQQLSDCVLSPLHSPVENFTCLRTY